MVLPALVVYCTTLVGLAIVYAAGLSFLGLGVSPPTAEWGSMLDQLRGNVYTDPLLALLPATTILLVSALFNAARRRAARPARRASAGRPMSGLEVRALEVTFAGGVEAVRGVDLSLPAGGTLVLLGESGSGKSATARAIVGLPGRDERVAGSITLAGRELTGLPARELRALRGAEIGLVGQDPERRARPAAADRAAAGGGAARHATARSRRARRAARERVVELLLGHVGLPRPEQRRRLPPARAVGRDAPTGRDRAGRLLPPAAADRRRADDRARRARAGARAGAVRRGCATSSAARCCSSPTTSSRPPPSAESVAVMYAGRIVERGPAARVLARAGSPIHARAAGCAAVARDPARCSCRRSPARRRRPTRRLAPGCLFAPRCTPAAASSGLAASSGRRCASLGDDVAEARLRRWRRTRAGRAWLSRCSRCATSSSATAARRGPSSTACR